jgi:hypothetical protein
MKKHLSVEEQIDALEGVLPQLRQTHLVECGTCQADVDALRAVMVDVETAGDVPEPSPLFWDHFHARVRSAVEQEVGAPAQVAWRQRLTTGSWTARMVVAMAAVVIVTVTATWPTLSERLFDDVAAPVSDAALAESTMVEPLSFEGAEWTFVTNVIGTLDDDQIREVLAPSGHAVDAAFETLSDEERQNFLKLLRAEMAAGMEQS